jgi:hypothetical protein
MAGWSGWVGWVEDGDHRVQVGVQQGGGQHKGEV